MKKLLYPMGPAEVGGDPRGTVQGRDVYDLAHASRYHSMLFELAEWALLPAVLVRAPRHLRATYPAVIEQSGSSLADEVLEFGSRDVVIEVFGRYLGDRLLPFPNCA